MKRNVYEVRWWERDDGSMWWGAFKRGIKEPVDYFAKKWRGAILYARDVARHDRPSQLVVKGRDGKIQFEWTYGSDPKRHKG